MTVMKYERDADVIYITGCRNCWDPFMFGDPECDPLEMDIPDSEGRPDWEGWSHLLDRMSVGAHKGDEGYEAFKVCYVDVLKGINTDWKLIEVAVKYNEIRFTYQNPEFCGCVCLTYVQDFDEPGFSSFIKIRGPKSTADESRSIYEIALDYGFIVFEKHGYLSRTIMFDLETEIITKPVIKKKKWYLPYSIEQVEEKEEKWRMIITECVGI